MGKVKLHFGIPVFAEVAQHAGRECGHLDELHES